MADKTQATLDKIRQRIDSIDLKIQALITERAQMVLDVEKIKRQTSENPIFYRPEREALVLKKVMQRPCSPLPEEEMAKIFRTIMSTCLALQQPLDIAFLGPEGTFSEQAVLKHFGHSANLQPVHSILDVFDAVASKTAAYGVVPIENSVGGIVNATMDAFIESSLQICGEVSLKIEQHLLAHVDAKENAIERIYSHEQSLLQCSKWLSKKYSTVEQIAVSSNAYAAQLASEDRSAAAVAGICAAEKYNLKAVAHNIENDPNNITRFLVLCDKSTPPSGDDRTSVIITINNTPGALQRLIAPFSKNDINLTLIKSQPSLHESGYYLFFLDIDAHQDSPSFAAALKELENESFSIKLLGSYPKAVL